MPISMRNHAPGMPVEAYDEAMAHVGEALRGTEGFISHSAEVAADEVTVTEVWESREQWRAWFDAAVRPHLPPGASEPVVTELHSALSRL